MRTWLMVGLLGCTGPTDEDTGPEVVPLEPPPEGQGFQVEMSTMAPAGEEVWACAIYDAPITGPANVSWVEYQQAANTHHMTLSTAFDQSAIPLANGMYDCDEVYTGRFMEEQVMMFGSQGEPGGTLELPPGVAATLPGPMKLVHEVHFVNTTSEDLEVFSRLNAWTIPGEEVVDGIWGGSVRDENINVPANTTDHREWSRCVMNRDVEVLFLASHMHARGVDFTIRRFDGTTVGEQVFFNDDWHDPLITKFDPPIVLKQGEGFEFECSWRNDDDFAVNYGLLSTDEMCNMAIVHTPFDFAASCEVVETSDGVLPGAEG
jgi:hypothetical protein